MNSSLLAYCLGLVIGAICVSSGTVFATSPSGQATTLGARVIPNEAAAVIYTNVSAGLDHSLAIRSDGTVLAWGNFVTIVINFVILAFVIFWMVKAMNRAKKKQEAAAAPTPEDTILLREIRDQLKRT